MSKLQPPVINLTEKQQQILEQIVRRQSNPQNLVRRAKIILEAATGANNSQVADSLGMESDTVRTWRGRWLAATDSLLTQERAGDNDKELSRLVEVVLSDAPRPGAPATFSPEQIVQIVAVACEAPSASGRPISHWTSRELADEVEKREIVSSISPRQVGRFLDEADLKPHLSRYWLNAKPDDPETFAQDIKTVCDAYQQAPQLHQQGGCTVSTDEKTGPGAETSPQADDTRSR